MSIVPIIVGLVVGLLVWFAALVWLPFRVPAIVLLVIAGAVTALSWWLYRATSGAFTRLLIVALATAVVIAVGWYGLLSAWVNRERVTDIEVLNAESVSGTALVVYHPGLSDFQRNVSYAFAEGLADSGWRVEITTASSQAPADLSGYGLLVLGAPTYDWLPAKRLQSYVKGLGDLRGQATVTIISGAGSTMLSQPAMEKLVRDANGDLVKSLAVWSMAPNEEVYGVSDPMEAMRREARKIPPPGE